MAAVCALRVTPAELRRRAEHRYALERDTKLQSPLNAQKIIAAARVPGATAESIKAAMKD